MKSILKKFVPAFLLSFYHRVLALGAAWYYGFPSRRLVVIGVTGTKGKSTTVNLLSRILEEGGFKTGVSSGLNFKVAEREWLSDLKMTMPGRFRLQKLLRAMVQARCQYAIIETTSEGILQHRHAGIWYDVLVFTNLFPEHLEAHGGFVGYKKTKLKLFEHLARLPHKKLEGKAIPKIIIANADSEHAVDFLNFGVDKKVTFSLDSPSDFQAQNVQIGQSGISYQLSTTNYQLLLLGQFDVYNSLAAIATANAFGIDLATAKRALEKVAGIPGRMELIANKHGLLIVVDYAHEPESLRQVYQTLQNWSYKNLIHVLGPTGGGRDRWRRPVMGELAAGTARYVIITTDDPYDDDPAKLANEMAAGTGGKAMIEIDRRRAIARALALAEPGDLVLITGKGAEQVMAIEHNRKIPWDDRRVVQEELLKFEARNPKS